MTELRVDVIPNGPAPFAVYHAGKCLGATNHRLYRQFRTYRMKMKLTAPYNGGVEVYILKDTWMVRNAIKKACEKYMNTLVLAPGQTTKLSRWHDFRLMPTDSAGGQIPALNPSGFVTNSALGPLIYGTTSTGQYDFSDMQPQNILSAQNKHLVIGGANTTTQFDILSAYMNSDDTTVDEAGVQDDYSQFFGPDEPQGDADDEGDLAPYNMTNLDNYLVKVDTLHTGKTTTANFDALLGWVFLRHEAGFVTTTADAVLGGEAPTQPFQSITSTGTTIACLQAIHAPGSYKGVYAPAIGKISQTPQQEYVVK